MSRRLVILALAGGMGVGLLGGCRMGWRPLADRDLDQERMVFPSNPPADGPFVAVRADGSRMSADEIFEPGGAFARPEPQAPRVLRQGPVEEPAAPPPADQPPGETIDASPEPPR